MTPEERAAKELEEELGFEIKKNDEGYTLVWDGGEDSATVDHWSLWFLALRQRVELNKLNESK